VSCQRQSLRFLPYLFSGSRRYEYSHDTYGNLTALIPGSALPASSATNRLATANVTYDGRGKMTDWGANDYFYSAFDDLHRHLVSTQP